MRLKWHVVARVFNEHGAVKVGSIRIDSLSLGLKNGGKIQVPILLA